MNDKENLNSSQVKIHPSETEVSDLVRKAAKQYEEYIRLADLADIADQDKLNHPKFSWDNPIGLVITGNANAKLV